MLLLGARKGAPSPTAAAQKPRPLGQPLPAQQQQRWSISCGMVYMPSTAVRFRGEDAWGHNNLSQSGIKEAAEQDEGDHVIPHIQPLHTIGAKRHTRYICAHNSGAYTKLQAFALFVTCLWCFQIGAKGEPTLSKDPMRSRSADATSWQHLQGRATVAEIPDESKTRTAQ